MLQNLFLNLPPQTVCTYILKSKLPETDVIADHQLEVSEIVRDGAVEEDVEGDGSPLILNALYQVG